MKRADGLRAKSTTKDQSSGLSIVIIAGGVGIAFLLLSVCIVGGVMCKKRSKQTTGDGPKHTVLYQKKNGPEMKILHMNGHADKLHIEIPRSQQISAGSLVGNVQYQTATLSRRSPLPLRKVVNCVPQSNGGASILAVVAGDSSLPAAMYQNNRDSVGSVGAIDCMSNLNTLQRQAWEEMIHDSANTAPDSAAGEANAMQDHIVYSSPQQDFSPDPAALPPPPPFLLNGRLPHNGHAYNEVLDGYHSEDNIDDDIEPIKSTTKLNLRYGALQHNQQQQLLHHQQNIINQHRQQHMNEERIPLNHEHVRYT